MKVSDFDYFLPEKLIAQSPSEKRDGSKLMVVDRKKHTIEHKVFSDIIDYLKEGDCLVLNDSRVIPARIFGKKESTGVDVEFLLIKKLNADNTSPDDLWQTMVRPGRRLKIGDEVSFGDKLKAKIIDFGEDGTRIVKFIYDGIFMERLEEVGNMPLPPYITRENQIYDKERYQTVYSRVDGSAAAPTAGLHFTTKLLDKIKAKGINIAYVTLHVGIGTFRPVKVEDVSSHHMHFENYTISEEAAKTINETKKSGGRVICVGTTSTRTLESSVANRGAGYEVIAQSNDTDIFIYPGYDFKIVDSLITNFHLPKSTLLMLISAFYDKEKILSIYETAIEEEYRFFSYGDAMLLL